MASQIIVQTNEADSQQHVSKVTASASAITLPTLGSGQSTSTVQRIVKTTNGTQIYLSGLPSNARAVGLNIGSKRSLTPDNASQPPSKIKITHSDSNVNLPVVSTVKTVGDDRNVLSLRTDGVKTPTKVMHVTGNSGIPANARRLVLSPVKSVGGKVTMVPLNTANQLKTVTNATKFINVGKSLSFNTNSTQDAATLSPQKIIIKGQDNSTHNVVLQQKNTSHTTVVNSSPNVQPIPVSGSKFQYVRLVSSNANNIMPVVSKSTSNLQTVTAQHRTLAPHTVAPTTVIAPKLETVLSSHKQQAQLRTTKSSHQPSQQRLILPATSQVAIRPNIGSAQYSHLAPSVAPSNTPALNNLPPGTAIISSGQNLQGVHGVQGFALVPAQYVTQLQQQFTPSQTPIQPSPQTHHSQGSSSRHDSSYVQVQQPAKSTMKVQSSSSNAVLEGMPPGSRPRKPCNCTKSQCLKLYCECFANGEFCYNCNCNNCYNNLEHEDERSRAIKACLDRNPNAFRPKIGKDKNVKGERRHNKGCNCKRSGCLKNYCECYEAKIMCSHLCKCVGCKNFEESPEKKTLMHLADAAEVRKQQQVSAKTKLSSQIQDLPSRPATTSTGRRLPYSFVTSDVCEATCSCLVAAAEETERTRQIDTIQEKLILEEFGRCLMQVIESANRTEPGTAV